MMSAECSTKETPSTMYFFKDGIYTSLENFVINGVRNQFQNSVAIIHFIILVSQCGVQNYQTPDRIVNGRNAAPGEWPWMVGLYYSPFVNDGGSPECGGTLIRDDVVVTAAHCLKPGVPPCSYAVRVGDYDLRENGRK